MLRIKFGKKEEEEEVDKKDDDGEKKAKHSIDGILGDKGREPPRARPEPAFPDALTCWPGIRFRRPRLANTTLAG